MRKFLSIFIFSIFLLSIFTPFSLQAAEAEDSYFIVTAYYSPLPDQKHYLTGNYEDEIILNGQGIAGASGKKVFSGMLAAPATYSFGTKIYLDGLGIGEVSDRGGAIVSAGQRGYSYDRIDVWMGYGDEGLRRAMFWGKRKVYGYIVDSGNKVDLKYDAIPSPQWVTTSLGEVPVAESIKIPSIFESIIQVGTESTQVKELQTVLQELGYMKADEISGVYDSATVSALYDFQIYSQILQSEQDIGAGVYGPRTRKELQKLYEAYLSEQEVKKNFELSLIPLKEEALNNAENYIKNIEKPLYGEISPRVRDLQKGLTLLGYFPHKDTAIFGAKTQNALLEYQLKKDIIQSSDDLGAGTFGPQTRGEFTKDLTEVYFQQLLIEKNLLEQYNSYFQDTSTEKEKQELSLNLLQISSKI